MSGEGHNSGVAADQLRAFVGRIERLDEEAKALNEDRRNVYAEAKAHGFDTKVMRKIIADRRKDVATRQEFDAIYDLYAHALGMAPGSEHLAPAPARAREEETESVGAEPPRTPESGENSADGISPSDNPEASGTAREAPSAAPASNGLGSAETSDAVSASPPPPASNVNSNGGANVTNDYAAQTKAAGDTPPVPPGPPPDLGDIPDFMDRRKPGGIFAHKN